MHTSLTSFNAQMRAMPAAPAARVNEQQSDRPAALVESAELLQGHKTVGILHNGSLYRLQATKLGKLILTK